MDYDSDADDLFDVAREADIDRLFIPPHEVVAQALRVNRVIAHAAELVGLMRDPSIGRGVSELCPKIMDGLNDLQEALE